MLTFLVEVVIITSWLRMWKLGQWMFCHCDVVIRIHFTGCKFLLLCFAMVCFCGYRQFYCGTEWTPADDLFLFAVYCLVPSSPRIVHILSRNATAAVIRWAPPERRNGNLLGYQLYISYDKQKASVNITDGHTNTYQITELSKQPLLFVNIHLQLWFCYPMWTLGCSALLIHFLIRRSPFVR